MLKKISILFVALLSIFATTRVYADEIEGIDIINGIWNYELSQANASDYQDYLEIGLVPYAGQGVEWQIICLAQWRPDLSFNAYDKAMLQYAESQANLKETDYMRIGLAELAMNPKTDRIEELLSHNNSASNIMALIYGLRLCKEAGYDSIKANERYGKALIAKQGADGGFSIDGKTSDPDVTAMALSSLAYLSDEYLDEIERAINFLSEIQLENGGYKSYGIENSESCAQVLIALADLGIDYSTDGRFLKNGMTVMDALLRFRNMDGGFCHILDGHTNAMASVQALLALEKIFCADIIEDVEDVENTTTLEHSEPDNSFSSKTIRIVIVSVIGLLVACYMLIQLCAKKLSASKIIIGIGIAIIGIVAALSVKIETPAEHYASIDNNGAKSTYIRIQGHDDEMLAKCEIKVDMNESAYDQLVKALELNGLTYSQSGVTFVGNIYIQEIAGLREFDYGPQSGWTYRINGEYPNMSCVSVKLQSGDYVEWIYVDE